MLRAPIWITSATSTIASTSRASISSVTIGRPVSALASASSAQSLDAEPLEAVRRGARLVRAAAQHRRARGGHRARRGQQLIARLHRARPRDQREVVAAHASPVDFDDGSLPCENWLEESLYGFRIGDDLADAGVALQAEALDVLAVADRADHGDFLAARQVRPRRRSPRSARTTAWMSSSVAVGFITIIIWFSTPIESVRKSGLRPALDPEVFLMDSALRRPSA